MHTHRGFFMPIFRFLGGYNEKVYCFDYGHVDRAGTAVRVHIRGGKKANYNIAKQADYFESERKITVYNARTDTVVMEAEGYMSISNNSNNELVCTVKVGPDQYKVNYIYLNAETMYVVEDITGTHTDPYHYKLYFHTQVLPSVEVKP